MELYFSATGPMHKLLLFEQRLNTAPMNMPFTDVDGKEKIQTFYGNLEEIKLYRYIFPKEELDSVLKTLDLPMTGKNTCYGKFDLQAAAFRKIMNAKKIPIPDPKAEPFVLDKEFIAIKGIGIKEDEVRTHSNGKTHEAL